MENSGAESVTISVEQMTAWAENSLRINHLETLVQRELEGSKYERAQDLSERARVRAWKMLNEMFAAGAKKPKDYCEPDGA
jgi:hypothetical protein